MRSRWIGLAVAPLRSGDLRDRSDGMSVNRPTLWEPVIALDRGGRRPAHVNLPARRRRHGGWRLGTGASPAGRNRVAEHRRQQMQASLDGARPSAVTGKVVNLVTVEARSVADIRLAADRSCPDRVRASRVGTRSARQGRMCCAPRRRSCEGVGQAVGMATGVRNSADNQARWKHFRRPISSTDRLIGAVPPPGLEPGTCGLKVRSSTN